MFVFDIPSNESSHQTSEGEEDRSQSRLRSRSGSDSEGDSDREHCPVSSGLELAISVGTQGILTNVIFQCLGHFTMNIVDDEITGTNF